jgi:hypothetical protein
MELLVVGGFSKISHDTPNRQGYGFNVFEEDGVLFEHM